MPLQRVEPEVAVAREEQRSGTGGEVVGAFGPVGRNEGAFRERAAGVDVFQRSVAEEVDKLLREGKRVAVTVAEEQELRRHSRGSASPVSTLGA